MVVAIIALLAVVLILTLNPSEALKKSRDSLRMSDLNSLKTAISLYMLSASNPHLTGANNFACKGTADDISWQPSDYIYYSYPNTSPGEQITSKNLNGVTFTSGGAYQVSSDNLAVINGNGWLPINFSSLIGGSPISNLPIDPINKIIDPANPINTDLVYRYACNEKTLKFELNARLESSAYTISTNKMAQDGGNDADYYEMGTDLSIFESEQTQSLVAMRDAQRQTDVMTILNAAYLKSISPANNFLNSLSTNWQMIGTAPSGCAVACGPALPTNFISTSSLSFIDSGKGNFDLGTYLQTSFSIASSSVSLTDIGITNKSGTYTSSLKNSNNANWLSLSWTPEAPYGKPLPNNRQTETSYQTGNINMSGNVLLFHADEASGATSFTDYSGLNNNGNCGLRCPQSVSGKINSGLSFISASSSIIVANVASLNPTTSITVEAWVKWEINPALGAPWASIVNKNLDNQYRLHHNSNNSKFEFAIAMNYIASLTTPLVGRWYHLVGTYDGSVIRFYVNGVEEANRNYSNAIPGSANPLVIGGRSDNSRFFNGSIDEVAIYNRALSSLEINDRYNRGARMLKIKVKTCPDQSCAGIDFFGPDGTANSYYSDNSSSSGLPIISFPALSGNYFAYQTTLETDNTSTPKFSNVTVNSESNSTQIIQIASTTLDACLNLNSQLVPTYLSYIPFDPSGNSAKTYYAIKKDSSNNISVMACSSEQGTTIIANQ